MSHFYGKIVGARGVATRCATKNSGLTTYAAGWKGAIQVSVSHTIDGQDQFTVELIPWQGSAGVTRTLAEGLLDSSSEQVSGMKRRAEA